MTTAVQKWGNSQGIRIPRSLLAEIDVDNGEYVELTVENGMLIIKKAAPERKRRSIEELFADYHGDYTCEEIDWGDKVGNEEW